MIELVPGVGFQQAVERLSRVQGNLGTVAGSTVGASPRQVLDTYLSWADSAEHALRTTLTSENLTELLHTRRHWHLRQANGQEVRLTQTVLAEVEDRQSALIAIRTELDTARQRWAPTDFSPFTVAVPDTTMFLDSEASFDAVDWRVAIDSRPGVRVVVPLTVIDELDRLKRQGNNTTARLAKAAIRWLSATLPFDTDQRTPLWTDGIHSVSIEVLPEQSPRRLADADADIIHTARALGSVSGVKATLVTRDLGMAVRARALHVPVAHVQQPDSPSPTGKPPGRNTHQTQGA